MCLQQSRMFFQHACYLTAQEDVSSKQTVIDDIFATIPVFYQSKDRRYHQMFEAMQAIFAMKTLKDNDHHANHDPYLGYLVLYYGVNLLFVPYKEIPYNEQNFAKLMYKTPNTTTKPKKMKRAMPTMILILGIWCFTMVSIYYLSCTKKCHTMDKILQN